jgi:hypothetical protein
MSRRFDGSDDEIRAPVVAGISNFTGAYTLVIVVRFRAFPGWQQLIGHHNSAASSVVVNFELNTQESLYIDHGGSGQTPNTNFNANTFPDDWWALAVSRPAGTGQSSRFHWKNLTAGSAWVHSGTGGTFNNPPSHSGGSIRIGEWRDTDDANMNVAIDAGWAANLSDSQIEGLFANNRTQDFLDLHATVPGAYCHQHNQATATEDILDLFSNGHTITGTISGTTDVVGIQGTAMDTATDPPGWTYLTSDTTPPTVNVTSGPTAKLSDEVGKNSYSYSFQADEACQAYEIRVVADAGDSRDEGTLVESGGAISANTTINGSVTYAELNAAGQGGEGQKILKFFARDTAGNWST